MLGTGSDNFILDFGFELYFRAYLAAGADEFGARAESTLLSIPIYPIIWFSVKMCNRDYEYMISLN